MKKLLISLLALSYFALAWAAPINPALISKNAIWYLHVDVDAMRAAPLTQEYMAEIDKAVNRCKELRLAGFNPAEDLQSVTAYGDHTRREGVVILKGSFDVELIKALIDTKSKGKVETYRGHRIIKLNKRKSVGALIDDHTIVMADRKSSMRRAIDVIEGAEPNLTLENSDLIVAGEGQLSHGKIVNLNKLKPRIMKKRKSNFLRNLEGLSWSVRFEDEKLHSQLKVNGVDAASGMNLTDLSKGARAFIALTTRNTELKKDMLSSLKITQAGNSASIAHAISTATIRKIIEEKLKR